MASTWKEKLQDKILKTFGQTKGKALTRKYLSGLSHSYLDTWSCDIVLSDIASMEKLSPQHPIEINLYLLTENNQTSLHLRLFQLDKSIALSDILPMLENFNLRTEREAASKVLTDKQQVIWISDFSVTYPEPNFDPKQHKVLFQAALTKIYLAQVENDGFNKLVLGAALSWREITILRAYAKYLRQTGFRFSQAYIEKALVAHPDIARDLVNFFITRHTPGNLAKATAAAEKYADNILATLITVTSLEEDIIIRRLLELMRETLRTNYFQTDANGDPKSYLSLKLNSRSITDLPLPVPLYEIFIYDYRFEGIHLRNAKVARGGIRWSDRREDFRTEILGLMKAQTVKNAVIVPSGAKGGFVLKCAPTERTALVQEGVACYTGN